MSGGKLNPSLSGSSNKLHLPGVPVVCAMCMIVKMFALKLLNSAHVTNVVVFVLKVLTRGTFLITS